MTTLHQPQVLLARDEIVAPPAPRACTDRDFGLPPLLHILTALCFLGFVTVLSAAFATPGLLVPYGVFVAFIVAYFTVPALWTRMKPQESRTRPLTWYEFRERGIETMTGRTPAGEATALVLILPFLILCWAIAVATIAALVS